MKNHLQRSLTTSQMTQYCDLTLSWTSNDACIALCMYIPATFYLRTLPMLGFDCLQYAKMEGGGFCILKVVKTGWWEVLGTRLQHAAADTLISVMIYIQHCGHTLCTEDTSHWSQGPKISKNCFSPPALDFQSSILVEALLWRCHLDVQCLLHQQLQYPAMVQHHRLLPVDWVVVLPHTCCVTARISEAVRCVYQPLHEDSQTALDLYKPDDLLFRA